MAMISLRGGLSRLVSPVLVLPAIGSSVIISGYYFLVIIFRSLFSGH